MFSIWANASGSNIRQADCLLYWDLANSLVILPSQMAGEGSHRDCGEWIIPKVISQSCPPGAPIWRRRPTQDDAPLNVALRCFGASVSVAFGEEALALQRLQRLQRQVPLSRGSILRPRRETVGSISTGPIGPVPRHLGWLQKGGAREKLGWRLHAKFHWVAGLLASPGFHIWGHRVNLAQQSGVTSLCFFTKRNTFEDRLALSTQNGVGKVGGLVFESVPSNPRSH